MRLVKREVPITEKNPHRSTKGIYRLADHFVRFWFRYVYPNRGLIEMGKGKRLYSARIRPDLDVFLGAVYEEICRQVIARDGQKWLGFEPFKVGRYWDAEREIDIIVENEDAGRATFVECKWGSRVHVDRELAELRKKAESLPHYTNVRKDYFVISRTPTKHPQHILFG
jgi:AAA+ ATPase superfamily predicted ATPase